MTDVSAEMSSKHEDLQSAPSELVTFMNVNSFPPAPASMDVGTSSNGDKMTCAEPTSGALALT